MIAFLVVLFAIACAAGAGWCYGYAAAAKKAAAEHRKSAEEFAELSSELEDLQARVREHTG